MSFSPELLAFVRRTLPSVWALEVLLLLRADPERAWTPASLVSELRASDALVGQILERLQRNGLVAPSPGGYRYAPTAAQMDELCDLLEAAYRERPVAVIKAISTPPDGVQALADAFRIKGDKN